MRISQRETRVVVVEFALRGFPTDLGMTGIAGHTQGGLVLVILAVASNAIRRGIFID